MCLDLQYINPQPDAFCKQLWELVRVGRPRELPAAMARFPSSEEGKRGTSGAWRGAPQSICHSKRLCKSRALAEHKKSLQVTATPNIAKWGKKKNLWCLFGFCLFFVVLWFCFILTVPNSACSVPEDFWLCQDEAELLAPQAMGAAVGLPCARCQHDPGFSQTSETAQGFVGAGLFPG